MFTENENLTAPASTAEMERRWALARGMMKEKGIDILIMRGLEEYLGGYPRWFTDVGARHTTTPLTVIFPRDDEMTLLAPGAAPPAAPSVPPAHALRGVKQRLNKPYMDSACWSVPWEAELALSELKKTPKATIGWVGFAHIPAVFNNALVKELPGAKFVDVTNEIDQFKAIKSPEEQEMIKRCAQMQDKIYEHLTKVIKPGMREFDIYNEAHFKGNLLGSERGLVLVSSAPKGTPTTYNFRRFQNRMLREGDQLMVLVELAGPGGMYAEISRPMSLGKPGQQQVDAHGISIEAQQLSLKLLKPGAMPGDVLRECNDFLVSKGYKPDLRIYAHGQGYDLVERPMFQTGEPMPVAAGMNLTVHPAGSTDFTWASVCDNYIIGPNGPGECLHKFSKDLIVLE